MCWSYTLGQKTDHSLGWNKSERFQIIGDDDDQHISKF